MGGVIDMGAAGPRVLWEAVNYPLSQNEHDKLYGRHGRYGRK